MLVVCHALTGNSRLDQWWGPLLGTPTFFVFNIFMYQTFVYAFFSLFLLTALCVSPIFIFCLYHVQCDFVYRLEKMICKGFSRRWFDDVKCLYVYELVVGRLESLKTFTVLPRLLLLIHTYIYILHRTGENI